ncbi:gliding motility-associated C-terminal domain-containing protein [Pedobacter sp. G11]|uniref:T9SS type B sorting domain-containing protein n=1 Tax=Pedobacter sp. G11 TaxID=2482728 RepID=UPI00143D5B93|nr:gliding motility-associated C-terminal domain-containing protein [Pedobacter sp. G11]
MKLTLQYFVNIFFISFFFFQASAQNSQIVDNRSVTTPLTFSQGICGYRWTNDQPGIGLPASGTGNIPSFTAVNNTKVPIVATITAVPASSGYAYIADVYLDVVSVIDINTNNIIARIPVGKGPTGVAVSPDGGKVYVANYDSHNVSVIDALENKVIATIQLDNALGSIRVSPDGKRVYVVDLSGKLITIDALTNTRMASLSVPASTYFMSINKDGSKIYLPNAYGDELHVINTLTNTIEATFSIGSGSNAAVLSPDGSRLYVSTRNQTVLVLDAAVGTLISTISINYPNVMTVSADGKQLYVTSQGNKVVIVNLSNNSIIANIAVNQYAEGLSLTKDGSRLYVIGQVGSTVSVINTVNNTIINRIRVGSNPYSMGDFVSGCNSGSITFKITVNPTIPVPSLLVEGPVTTLSTRYGTPSEPTSFSLSGSNLSSDVKLKAPDGFQISTDEVNYFDELNVSHSGTIIGKKIFVRLSAKATVGKYNGALLISSDGAASIGLQIPESSVSPAILTIMVNSLSRYQHRENPILTAQYFGFVNGETPANLITLPWLSTLAVLDSPAGDYVISVSNAASINYEFLYIPGLLSVLAVEPVALVPNSFSPNGDGINDYWQIKNLETHIDCTVQIFNRSGNKIFSSVGYLAPWNGTYNGKPVPVGTYFYKITFPDGSAILSGSITVLM